MRRLLIFTLALFVFGCSSEGFERFKSKKDHLSVRRLSGWSRSRQKGTLVFSAPEEYPGTTIAIRSVVPPKGVLDAGSHKVVDATKRVLSSLHRAKVRGPTQLEHESLSAFAFDLTYEPPDKAKLYERRHVVLISKDRVFHVFHTAPQGQLGATDEIFSKVVDSLREEG